MVLAENVTHGQSLQVIIETARVLDVLMVFWLQWMENALISALFHSTHRVVSALMVPGPLYLNQSFFRRTQMVSLLKTIAEARD